MGYFLKAPNHPYLLKMRDRLIEQVKKQLRKNRKHKKQRTKKQKQRNLE